MGSSGASPEWITREQPRILLLENDWMAEKGWASQQRQEAPRETETAGGEEIMMSSRDSWTKHLAAILSFRLVEQLLHTIQWRIKCNSQAPCIRGVYFRL